MCIFHKWGVFGVPYTRTYEVTVLPSVMEMYFQGSKSYMAEVKSTELRTFQDRVCKKCRKEQTVEIARVKI